MLGEFVSTFINILASALYVAILARVIVSWVAPSSENPIVAVIYQITEPVLAPLRRVLPSFGMIDLSPMAALLIIMLIQWLL